MIRIGILGSTRGTNLAAIQQAIEQKTLDAEIAIVISNKADAFILDQARAFHLSTQFINPKDFTRPEYDAKVTAVLKQHDVKLIVLIGYMRILSEPFVDEWQQKIINVHPSLLPAFAGLMDLNVHRAVIAAGVKETGCTVHYVTKEVDAGPILLQKKCAVLTTDTPESLKSRVQSLEAEALIETIRWFKTIN